MTAMSDMIQKPKAPGSVAPPELVSIDDTTALRDSIFDKVKTATAQRFPIENDRYRIDLTNVGYKGGKPFTKNEQKDALMKSKSLHWKLYGDWALTDKTTGKVVDARKGELLAHVPYMTERGTFIRSGNEYTVANQSRLRPGAYSRFKANDELETHFNILAGGRSFHVIMDPATAKFTMAVGGAKLNLYPVLRTLGVKDEDMKQAWGHDVLDRNRVEDDSAKRAMHQFYRGSDPDMHLSTVMGKMKLDPEVMQQTLGAPHSNVDGHVIMKAAGKLLGISRGEQREDDRDALHYQKLMFPDELLAERIEKDWDRRNTGKLLWQSSRKNALAVYPGHLTPQLDAVFTKSGLAQCFDDRTSVLTQRGFVPWPLVRDDDKFACNVGGELRWCKAKRIVREHYFGDMICVRTKVLNFVVTPNHRVWHRTISSGSTYKFKSAADIVGKGIYVSSSLCRLSADFYGPDVLRLECTDNRHGHAMHMDVPMDVWAEFLGWYVSEGSAWTTARKEGTQYRIAISQRDFNVEEHAAIDSVLSRLGVAYHYNKGNSSFIISSNKLLFTGVSECGFGCANKRIPRYLFDQPEHVLKLFFNSYIAGDGHLEAGKYYKATTASHGLAEDLVELAGRLGYTGRISINRKKDGSIYYVVTFGLSKETTVANSPYRARRGAENPYSTVKYDGVVYCAEVPGGLLYVMRNGKPHWSGNSIEEVNPLETLDQRYRVLRTGEGGISESGIPAESRSVQPSHFGLMDPIRSPESGKIGVDSRLSVNAYRGKDGQLYSKLTDAKTGELRSVPVKESVNSIVAFPGELARPGRRVRAMNHGRLEYVDRDQVQYQLAHPTHMFTVGTNMVPMVTSVGGQRALMGGKFLSQSLPLKDAESPLVQNLSDDGKSTFEELYGTKAGAAVRSHVAGRVSKITKDSIVIDTPKGPEKFDMYDNFPYNRKSSVHNTPLVRLGDHVTPGQLLAKSNFTDNSGTLALGKNLRVAFMPWKGGNYEDGIVISQSAANKLTSEHIYPVKVDHDTHTQRGIREYVSLFPTKFTAEQHKLLDDDGVVKVGRVVHAGDPLILAVRERPQTEIHRGRKAGWIDASETWGHESDGVVTNVEKDAKGARIYVKTYKPTQNADKISGRYGDKGVVTVIPDEHMPHDKDGNPMEVLLNPMGVVTRQNPAQLVETVLGKIAEKTGKPYRIPSFSSESLIDFAVNEAKKHGVSDTEDLTDPVSGRTYKNILTGKRFMMKLHFLAEKKQGARDIGGYTMEDMPARGGVEGAKKLGVWDINALLSHGATDLLRDNKTIRGQKNDEYWKAFQMGYTPPSPEVPMIYRKFLSGMMASGINVKKSGSSGLQILAMTDKDVDGLSRGEIKEPRGINAATMQEIPGGLFDPGLTGGHNGTGWTHINLDEPIPNPIMEEPIRRMLGMTKQKFTDVLTGKEFLNGRVGGDAIQEALRRLDPKVLRQHAENDIRSGAKSKRSNAIKLLRYVAMMEHTGLKPDDFMMSKVPVLPPVFRPIAATANFTIKADANSLYVDLMKHNQALKDIKKTFGHHSAGEERLNLYNSYKAIAGLGETINPKLKNQEVRGLLSQIMGSSPKFGSFQYKVLGGTLDQSGLAVVTPSTQLDMDHVGLPENHAWTLYRKFVIRKLVQRGMKPTDAVKAVENRTGQASDVLHDEMAARPIVINRAPTLHKYNLMGFYPTMVKGNTLQVSPLVTSGFGMDFDGDTALMHVPVSDKAVDDVKKRMLPSRNLFAIKDFDVHYLPSQEFAYGLYLASSRKKAGPPKDFATKAEAIAAYKRGEIDVDDRIRIRK